VTPADLHAAQVRRALEEGAKAKATGEIHFTFYLRQGAVNRASREVKVDLGTASHPSEDRGPTFIA
jgi:hypothetical protein